MKKIKLSLISGSFYFLEDLSLKKGQDPIEVSLDGKSDAFKAALAKAILYGQLGSDMSAKEVIALIKNDRAREQTEVDCRFKDPVNFRSTEEAPIEVLEMEVEGVVTENTSSDEGIVDAPSGDTTDPEPEPEPEPDVMNDPIEMKDELKIPEATLADLLKGKATAVVGKINSATLSESDVSKLTELELAGRKRMTVLAILKEK